MILITLMWVILMSTTLVHADDYRISGWDSLAIEARDWNADEHGRKRGEWLQRKRTKENEITGQTTAWLFGLANLTVILSLLIKGTIRLFPLTPPGPTIAQEI